MSEPADPIFEEDDNADQGSKKLTGQQTYNVISDLGVGPNVRLKDNVLQAICIFISTVLGVVFGIVGWNFRFEAIVLGGFAGLLVGLFGSGTFIMIYRLLQHSRGKHD